MFKKLKKWLMHKIFQKEIENVYELLRKIIKEQREEIKNLKEQIGNLKKQINFLTMKGPML